MTFVIGLCVSGCGQDLRWGRCSDCDAEVDADWTDGVVRPLSRRYRLCQRVLVIDQQRVFASCARSIKQHTHSHAIFSKRHPLVVDTKMICTLSATEHNNATFPFPGPAPILSPREIYLRALEHERNVILADAYAQKGAPFPSRCSSSSSMEVNPPTPPAHTYNRASYFSEYPPSNLNYSNKEQEDFVRQREVENSHRYDDRGRLMDFRESVRQRQERLEFLRRQEFARRLALKGLTDSRISEYAIRRLAPPQARPAERLNAALKIQRAYRAHLAGKRILNALTTIANDLDTAQNRFAGSQRRNDGTEWAPAGLRRATAGMRFYSNTLSRLRLDFADLTRPLRSGKIRKVGHAQSVVARIRAVDRVLAEEYEVLEKTKVNVGIAEMRSKMSKRPWMVMIEEQVDEEEAAEAEMAFEEEEEDDVLVYYTEDCPISSPATSLSTLSDVSLEEIDSEGDHYTVEARVVEDDDSDSEPESEFEFSHNEFALPIGDDEDDEDDVPSLRRTLALSLLFSASTRRAKQDKHMRKRHPILLSDFDLHMSKRLIGGSAPVSRTPSLGSIVEDDE